MGTRCLTTVMDRNEEILCLYRQFDGYPEGHGIELLAAFKGWRVSNGIGSGVEIERSANGMGCFAAQVVQIFKTAGTHDRKAGHVTKNGAAVGGYYIYAPRARGVGEEFIYRLSERDGRIWLDVSEGEIAFFGLPGTKPELMEWLYSGFLDEFHPDKCGMVHHV